MEILSLIEAVITFIAVIVFFVTAYNIGEIQEHSRKTYNAMVSIHKMMLEKQIKEQQKEESAIKNKIVEPGTSIEL